MIYNKPNYHLVVQIYMNESGNGYKLIEKVWVTTTSSLKQKWQTKKNMHKINEEILKFM